MVADRGLLSLDSIDALAKLTLPDAQLLEFILAVPGRRYGEFTEILEFFQAKAYASDSETIEEARWQGWRLLVADDPCCKSAPRGVH